MSSAPPTSGQGKQHGQAGDQSNSALAEAVRLQRRRHHWTVAFFWFFFAFLFFIGSASDASEDGTPAPAWYIHLEYASAVAAVVVLCVVIGFGVALGRRPTELRAQAIALERRRLQQNPWPRRIFNGIILTAMWLGTVISVWLAFLGVFWTINGVTYLAGSGVVVEWASPTVYNDGDAATSLIVGLLFVGSGIGMVFALYRFVIRRWWRLYLARKAEQGAISWPPTQT